MSASSEVFVPDEVIESCNFLRKKSTALRRDVHVAGVLCALIAVVSLLGGELSWVGLFLAPLVGALLLFMQLMVYWVVPFKVWCSYTPCGREQATHVNIQPVLHSGQQEVAELQQLDAAEGVSSNSSQQFFEFQKRLYFANDSKVVAPFRQGVDSLMPAQSDDPALLVSEASSAKPSFAPLELPVRGTVASYLSQRGLNKDQVMSGARLCGINALDIPLRSFSDLMREQAMAPFFVFQMFCVLLWCLDEYWYYSILTGIMLVIFEATLVIKRRKDMKQLRSVRADPYSIEVYRNNAWVVVTTEDLLPGDIASLRGPSDVEEVVASCDMLLLQGTVVVNEAMLTGESVPQLKEAVSGLEGSDLLDMEAHKKHMIYSGTTLVTADGQAKPSPNSALLKGLTAPRNGCLVYVLRTGFDTAQGSLVQTILFSTRRVSVTNKESMLFILFLLCFAIVASAYVLYHGLQDAERDKYKLFLNCIMIVTSVVPPELPMELTLAVNNALAALQKTQVFCTEPFRIPFAGSVDHICFDKTGTLTLDEFTLKGIAGLVAEDPLALLDVKQAPAVTQLVIGGCHSLAVVGTTDAVVGDSLEIAALEGADFRLKRGNVVLSAAGDSIKIERRFNFSSALKRMSCIITSVTKRKQEQLVVCKGAAEVVRNLLTTVPKNYDLTHQTLSMKGCRVLAMAYKKVKPTTSHLTRKEAESGLTFAGFIVLECPLKKDVADVITKLKFASNTVCMITGDHLFTACHVAEQVDMRCFTDVPFLQLTCSSLQGGEAKSSYLDGSQWVWRAMALDSKMKTVPLLVDNAVNLPQKADLSIEGADLQLLSESGLLPVEEVNRLLCHITVFARASPAQKEQILLALKQQGKVTVMCGDGTNDVGALKQAHVGVALLANAVIEKAKKDRQRQTVSGEPKPMKLGDASIASPFTSKKPHPVSILNIVRQGRCTLVTTRQMYMILASNSLLSAYGMSVLYLEGVKMGDTQMTVYSIAIAFLFLALSLSKPLEQLSKERPRAHLFHTGMWLSLLGQFSVHMYSLISVVNLAWPYRPTDAESLDPEGDFTPNILNTVVFLISWTGCISTFFANYRGHPFKQSLRENKAMWRMLLAFNIVIYIVAMGLFPELNETLECSPFPSPEFQLSLLYYILFDQLGTYVLAKTVHMIFK